MNKQQKVKYKRILKALENEGIFSRWRWKSFVEDHLNPKFHQGGMLPLGKGLGYLGIYYSPQLDHYPALKEVRNDIDELLKVIQKHRNNPKVKFVKS